MSQGNDGKLDETILGLAMIAVAVTFIVPVIYFQYARTNADAILKRRIVDQMRGFWLAAIIALIVYGVKELLPSVSNMIIWPDLRLKLWMLEVFIVLNSATVAIMCLTAPLWVGYFKKTETLRDNLY